MANYTVEDAREALERHVRTTRWLRRGLAKKLDITSFETSGAFHVVFQSFTERRTKSAAFEAYWNQSIDGPENGPEPDVWDLSVPVPGWFINQSIALEVPHTATVRTCHVCGGGGEVRCDGCNGLGRNTCLRCGGDGRVTAQRMVTSRDSQGNTTTRWESYTTTCATCGGDGRVTCGTCGGTGWVTCSTCTGARRLKHFRRMDVTWTTHTSEHIIEKSDLPDELVSDARGTVLLQEEENIIRPQAEGGGGPFRGAMRVNPDVHRAANQLIERHRFPDEKLHRQRLTVRGVPVHEASYAWGKETRRFWVVGLDEQVHAPRYPLSVIRLSLAAGVPCAVLVGVMCLLMVDGSADRHRRESPKPSPTPPAVTTFAAPHPAPPPAPAPAPLLSASAAPPKARPGQTVVELRTDPPGVTVLVGKVRKGTTPLFLPIPSQNAGPCKGGYCAGGSCTGGRCVGGVCMDRCVGATCSGATCTGATCEGATCPKGYRCSGSECKGRQCLDASCEQDRCVGQDCSDEVCFGGRCAGDPCRGGTCSGGSCSGGICEPATTLTLRREGYPDIDIVVGPSDGPVIEKRLPWR